MGAYQSAVAYYDTSATPVESSNNWMSNLPDNVLLSGLSIPGTQGSVVQYGGHSIQCQSWSLLDQLGAGIRFLDMYLYYYKGDIYVYRGGLLSDGLLEIHLSELNTFLGMNPTECVILRIHTESPYFDFGDHFRVTFRKTIDRFERISKRKLDSIPRLGDIRGTLIFIHNTTFINVGLRETSETFHLTDEWRVPSLFSRKEKWRHVHANMHRATEGKEDQMYISYCSDGASMWAYTYAVASHVNYYCLEYLKGFEKGRVGIVALNYPGQELIQDIIEKNKSIGPREEKEEIEILTRS